MGFDDWCGLGDYNLDLEISSKLINQDQLTMVWEELTNVEGESEVT